LPDRRLHGRGVPGGWVAGRFRAAHERERAVGPYDYMSAGGTVAAIPVILLVIFFQRYVIQGIVAGAVKE
ncbi:MAG: hypothetical protein ACRDTR_10950, partial [Rubrobacter sp.]